MLIYCKRLGQQEMTYVISLANRSFEFFSLVRILTLERQWPGFRMYIRLNSFQENKKILGGGNKTAP